jgi:hypothetical protein
VLANKPFTPTIRAIFERTADREVQRRLCYVEPDPEQFRAAVALQLSHLNDRLDRFTDAYVDQLIEKNLFEQRKNALLAERTNLEQRLAEWKTGKHKPADELASFLERADGAYWPINWDSPRKSVICSIPSPQTVSFPAKLPKLCLLYPSVRWQIDLNVRMVAHPATLVELGMRY